MDLTRLGRHALGVLSSTKTLRSDGKVVAYGMTSTLRSGRLAGWRGAGRSHPPRPASLIHRCEYLSIGVTRRMARPYRTG